MAEARTGKGHDPGFGTHAPGGILGGIPDLALILVSAIATVAAALPQAGDPAAVPAPR